ncbi:biotin synthase BioB [Treponema zioleckii]|uniref:biotin synthase BioB n=1 Tax=Treponema zioleckii TaxID=331680 RepID=UPI00168ACBFD|nr:biotin synthase BioB [Treponema zioleckii]
MKETESKKRTDIFYLAQEIIESGKRLSRNDDLSFFKDCDLNELCSGADLIRKHFSGNHVDLCSIINGRGGHCGENCKFCAQSAHNNTGCDVHGFLNEDTIFKAAKKNADAGVHRFGIVCAGRSVAGEDFEKAISAFKKMHSELKIKLCASMGFLTQEQLEKLVEAGVTSYHHNIETSKRNFPNICTSHTYEMKIETIKMAQKAGLNVCSGGIIGMGETFEDRIDMALSLSELGIKSIPLNALMAIPGTPYENIVPLTEDEILRTVAMFRFINPEANIRLAAGRKLLSNSGEKAFNSGASASITGDMLTTCGTTTKDDKELLLKLGREI